ncbi:hypothetical protein CLU79DRAFT_206248 [Phycomyces nitens]|nr:hypothetical protein CLU79DRAFT_206248 [Phycomyces nitens]
MKRPNRPLFYLLVLIAFSVITVVFIPSFSSSSLSQDQAQKIYTYPKSSNEKYLSYFPHGNFVEQHESLRNAIRLGHETNRTIIAPSIRLGKFHAWAPFPVLAKHYEAQDKKELRRLCSAGEGSTHWRTLMEPCATLNDWTEIKWSSLFDLTKLNKRHGIRIIERDGYGWGAEESALGGRVDPQEIMVVDTMSFFNNGTEWEITDEEEVASGWQALNWAQSHLNSFRNVLKPSEDGSMSEKPLSRVLRSDQLLAIEERLVQFGSLAFALRYETSSNKRQADLHRQMARDLLVFPDKMPVITAAATDIMMKMGGMDMFSVLHLNLGSLVESEARYADDVKTKGTEAAVDDEIEKPFRDIGIREDLEIQNYEMPVSKLILLSGLSADTRKSMMESVLLQVSGDIPINQAISAALPFKPSLLLNLTNVDVMDQSIQGRSALLEACIDYKQKVDQLYPIYYLVNDLLPTPQTYPDIFGSLFKMFPCTFSKSDMFQMGALSTEWTAGQKDLTDNVDYEELLGPILDIIVAGKAYSFFEIPQTPLTRLVDWQ